MQFASENKFRFDSVSDTTTSFGVPRYNHLASRYNVHVSAAARRDRRLAKQPSKPAEVVDAKETRARTAPPAVQKEKEPYKRAPFKYSS